MPSNGLKRGLPLIGLALLTSCAAASSSPPVNACQAITLQPYPPAEQARLADEMQAAPATAAWPGWITGYGRLRAAVRACQAAGS